MASKEDEATATQPLTSDHDKETNKDALSVIEVKGQVGLKKEVTLLNGIALVIGVSGVIIGSGTIISPKGGLAWTESVGMSLVVWVGCGILALLGSLCYCKMGTMLPKSGVEYSYLYEAFGPLPAFLYSWTLALIVRPSSLSAMALTFASYVSEPFFPHCEISAIPVKKILAATCLALTMFINCASVKWAMRIQNIFTFGQLIALSILIVIGLIDVGSGNLHNSEGSFDGTTSNLANMGLAFYSGLWAYNGWNSLNFVTEEMKNPARDLPRALMIGIPLVTIAYLLTNIACIDVVGGHCIFNSGAVAMVVGEEKMGPVAWLIPIFVACSTFGCVNGLAFSGARLVFVSARNNGHMPKVLSMVHKTCHTPMASIIFLHVIAMIMLIPDSSEFSTLINYFSFSAWLSYFAVITALMYLRWKCPHAKRLCKVWLIVPIGAYLAALYLLITLFWQEPKGSAMALIFIALGIPVYFSHSRDACEGCCAISVSPLHSELTSYIKEELELVQDELLCMEGVCSKLECEMPTAVLSEHERELEGLRQDWCTSDNFYSKAMKRKEDLLALGKGENIDSCLNLLCSDLRCLSEVEDWRKTDKQRARENKVVGLIAALHQQNIHA